MTGVENRELQSLCCSGCLFCIRDTSHHVVTGESSDRANINGGNCNPNFYADDADIHPPSTYQAGLLPSCTPLLTQVNI